MTLTATHESVLIVGGSAAGLATAEGLRRRGHVGPLTVVDAETRSPYDRPPLSKGYLAGTVDAAALALRPQHHLDALGAHFCVGASATALDVDSRTVCTADGEELTASHVVIATGASPRWIPGEGLDGAHVLRSVADADRLRSTLRDLRGPFVVVGHGVLGSEIAATAVGLGVSVTLVGRGPAPMSVLLGQHGASALAERHSVAGVRLMNNRSALRIDGIEGHVSGVVLDDGTTVPATAVVVALGCTPNTGWLEGSGLAIDAGVICDGQARAAEGVWAVGDVARFHHRGLSAYMRLENRTNATEMAQTVAGNILGGEQPYMPVPYFWTDQYGIRIQVFGAMTPADHTVIAAGDPSTGRFVAVAEHEGRTTGVLGWGIPKQARIESMPLREHYKPTLVPAL